MEKLSKRFCGWLGSNESWTERFLCSARYRRAVYFKQRRDLQLNYITGAVVVAGDLQPPEKLFNRALRAERRRRNQLKQAQVGSISFMGIALFVMVDSAAVATSHASAFN